MSSPYAYRLEIVRQDTDASIDLTTYNWAIAVAFDATPRFLYFAIPGTGIVLYALYSLFNSYRGRSDQDKGAKFLAIVVLLLVGTLFCQPLVKGTLAGDFTPRNTLVSLPDETYPFTLNGTHPTSSLNLSTLYQEGKSSVSIKIHSLTSSEYPLHLSIITDSIYNIILEVESNDNDWWITIPLGVNSPSVVSFERIDTDLNGEFSVEIQYQTPLPREDIILPAIFGVFGLIAIIGGLSLAYRLDS